MTINHTHRLEGIEPDNLLGFMALLGLLRVLEEASPSWCPKVSWSENEPPIRPILHLAEAKEQEEIVEMVAKGLSILAPKHIFEGLDSLKKLMPKDAAERLRVAVHADRYTSDLWAALISNAVTKKGEGKELEPTPLSTLMSGRMNFLKNLSEAPKTEVPPDRGAGAQTEEVSESKCLCEALFAPWTRPDKMRLSFRWDLQEDARYALRATDPSDSERYTQHGANRLAAIGLSTLTVTPQRRGGKLILGVTGGRRNSDGKFIALWPIWRNPISLPSIKSLLTHSGLEDATTCLALGVFDQMEASLIPNNKYYSNFTRAQSI